MEIALESLTSSLMTVQTINIFCLLLLFFLSYKSGQDSRPITPQAYFQDFRLKIQQTTQMAFLMGHKEDRDVLFCALNFFYSVRIYRILTLKNRGLKSRKMPELGSFVLYRGFRTFAAGKKQALKISVEVPEWVSQQWLEESPGMLETRG